MLKQDDISCSVIWGFRSIIVKSGACAEDG